MEFFVIEKISVIQLTTTKIIISRNEATFTEIGDINDDIPKMNSMLNIFDPTTLPTAIPVSPFLAATIDVTSSGSDVPTATIVSPIIVSDIPSTRAISLAE